MKEQLEQDATEAAKRDAGALHRVGEPLSTHASLMAALFFDDVPLDTLPGYTPIEWKLMRSAYQQCYIRSYLDERIALLQDMLDELEHERLLATGEQEEVHE